MNAGRQSMEEIFLAALELPDAGRRKEFLDRECGGSTALRDEMERLLSVHAEAERYFAEMALQLNQMLPTAFETGN
jgi:hypothetical protein